MPQNTQHLKTMVRMCVVLALCSGVWVMLLLTGPAHAQPHQQASVGELLSQVNAYRASRGRAALQTHPSLMAAAQSHAQYVASTQNYGHIGEGGSTIIERAVQFGFRGYVYENFAYGSAGFASTAWAVDWWSRSAVHNTNMLRTVTHIGAGVATGPESTVFVLMVGEPYQNDGWAAADPNVPSDDAESANNALSVASGAQGVAANVPAEPAPPPAVPLVKSEPRADGSIVHTVQHGQTPWDVSVVYGVPLDDIFFMNNLRRGELVYPGDELIVRLAAGQPTPDRHSQPHLVQDGESMWGIASRYNIPIGDLLVYNGMAWGDVIVPGDIVLLAPPTPAPTNSPAPTDALPRADTAAPVATMAIAAADTATPTPSTTPTRLASPTATPLRLNTAVARDEHPPASHLTATATTMPQRNIVVRDEAAVGGENPLLIATVGFLVVVGISVIGLAAYATFSGGQRRSG